MAWMFPFYNPSRDLALLDALSDEALFPWRLQDAASRQQPKEWRQLVNVRGFSPSEVSVKAEGGKVRVQARHVDGENVTEVQRTLQLPDSVQEDKVNSFFTRDGALVVRAPFKEKQGASESVWDEVRELLRGPDIADAKTHVVKGEDGQQRFKAEISVREFKPEEVRVRQQNDCVMVVAEHNDEQKGQRVHRRLERAFRLPEGTKLDNVVSRLSHDGRLCIEAPYEPPAAAAAAGNAQIKDVPMETEQQEIEQKKE